MGEEGETYRRNTPVNELDLQLMIVDSEWGKEIAPELKNRLSEIGTLEQGKDGKLKVNKSHLWGLLSYYTRDMRLGNLDKDSYIIAIEWLNFAGDCVRLGMVKSFLTALSRVITILELSQSRGGFLRKQLNTFRQEHQHEFNENKNQKGLFNSKKKSEGY